MLTVQSPITKTENVIFISHYEISVTSDLRIIKKPVDNYLCLDSGIVFNATGSLGEEKKFYTDEYNLHGESLDSEFKYFEENKSVGMYDEIINFIEEKTSLPTNGDYLDIGCGKGTLIKKFSKKFPNWSVSGVEPSKNAAKFFSEKLPNVCIFEGVLEDSFFPNNKYDLISANGVLEHIPDPVNFLKMIKSMIRNEGYIYIGVPNFVNNPADLFTYDHLFRFTPSSIQFLFEMAGLKIVHKKVDEQRVPMWFLLKPVHDALSKNISVDILNEQKTINDKLNEIKSFFKSYDYASDLAKSSNKKVAVYGTGSFIFLAEYYSKLTKDLLGVIIDDNSSIWGEHKMGVTVDSPQSLFRYKDITGIVFSANPCYLDLLTSKVTNIVQLYKLTHSIYKPS